MTSFVCRFRVLSSVLSLAALAACGDATPDPAGTGTAGTAPGSSGSNPAGAGGSTQGGTPAASGNGNVTAGTAAGGVSQGAGGTTGNTAGSTNVGGSIGIAGSGMGGTSSGGTGSTLSPGCNKDSAEDPTKWSSHDINVSVDAKFADKFSMRRYFTRPPKAYDKSKPTPLVIWGQGCGQSVAENTPLTGSPAADVAIQMEMLADPDNHQCYSAGPDGDDPKSPELPYFDAALAEVLSNYCVDLSRIFMGGYSSGGWLSALVSCNRAQLIRGTAWAAAGLQKNHDACVGPVAAIITRGADDGGTPLDQTLAARDSFIMRNGCSMETKPWDMGEAAFNASSCLEYQGCKPGYPVVWCPTPGGHSNGSDTGLSTKGFWKFWSALP
jgi:hypothetical protein